MSNNLDQSYKKFAQIITGPNFRNPIKDFMDENCTVFTEAEENTFEMGGYYNEFLKLLENLLNKIKKELNITEDQFLEIMNRGLNDPKYKRYFQQLINFNNYQYFKKIMVNRNYQIIKIIEDEMRKRRGNIKEKKENDEYHNQLEIAKQISLQEAEELRKLKALEEQELNRAIKKSKKENWKNPEDKKIEKEKKEKEQKEKKEKERKEKEEKELEVNKFPLGSEMYAPPTPIDYNNFGNNNNNNNKDDNNITNISINNPSNPTSNNNSNYIDPSIINKVTNSLFDSNNYNNSKNPKFYPTKDNFYPGNKTNNNDNNSSNVNPSIMNPSLFPQEKKKLPSLKPNGSLKNTQINDSKKPNNYQSIIQSEFSNNNSNINYSQIPSNNNENNKSNFTNNPSGISQKTFNENSNNVTNIDISEIKNDNILPSILTNDDNHDPDSGNFIKNSGKFPKDNNSEISEPQFLLPNFKNKSNFDEDDDNKNNYDGNYVPDSNPFHNPSDFYGGVTQSKYSSQKKSQLNQSKNQDQNQINNNNKKDKKKQSNILIDEEDEKEGDLSDLIITQNSFYQKDNQSKMSGTNISNMDDTIFQNLPSIIRNNEKRRKEFTDNSIDNYHKINYDDDNDFFDDDLNNIDNIDQSKFESLRKSYIENQKKQRNKFAH